MQLVAPNTITLYNNRANSTTGLNWKGFVHQSLDNLASNQVINSIQLSS